MLGLVFRLGFGFVLGFGFGFGLGPGFTFPLFAGFSSENLLFVGPYSCICRFVLTDSNKLKHTN